MENEYLQKIKDSAIKFFVLVIILFFLLYLGFKGEGDKLGVIGDYFGGMLNPVFGFLSLLALLYTINIQLKALKIQSEELKLTREELEATREELARSAKAQEQSSAIFKQQQFETTFFSLINQLNGEITKFNGFISKSETSQIIQSDSNEFTKFIKSETFTSDSVPLHFTQKPIEWKIDDFEMRLQVLKHKMYYLHDSIGKLPEILKVLLNFIKNSKIERREFYVNIVKSILNKDVLYVIAIVGYEDPDLRNNIEENHILEFMPFRLNPGEDPHPILRLIAHKYQHSAFGENIYLQDLIKFEQWLIIRNQHISQDRETSDAN